MHLSDSSDPGRPNGAWWFYFALLVLLSILSLLGSLSALNFAFGIVNAFGLVGLVGYIRQLAIGSRAIWAGYFAVSVVLSLVALSLYVADSAPPAVLLIAFVLAVPLYYALWQYAFRSPLAWQATDA
jgi:heme/copper-type cytochrome/quinol oxidase subunit 4